jgi:hypothetical protein
VGNRYAEVTTRTLRGARCGHLRPWAKWSATMLRMTQRKPTNLIRAHELLERLHEPTHNSNGEPVTPLTNASAEAIAMAALAHAMLDLTDQVSEIKLGLSPM